MDASCLQYRLTDAERKQFEDEGYLIVENALSDEHVELLSQKTDEIYEEKTKGKGPNADLRGYLDYIQDDPMFADLVDYPQTFTKVWDILGWNIKLYAAQMAVTPPSGKEPNDNTFGWHQDSGMVNQDIEYSPKPRLSLKVVFFLSDMTQPGRANFWIIPGSQLQDKIDRPENGIGQPEGAIPVCVGPGTAVIFDRRLWHAASENWSSDVTRKALFYGYSYRWLQDKFAPGMEKLWKGSHPIRQQLFGKGVEGNRPYSPREEDVPLRTWMKEYCPEKVK